MDGTAHRRVVVVGVDGSPGADAALRFAMEEASRRDAVVRAVMAVRPPELYAVETLLPDPADGRDAAAADVGRHIQALREQVGLAVEADADAVTGSPVHVLVAAAQDSELLVVGHRGRGPWRSALLGSVGLGTVLQAPCPVTVVPSPEPVTPAYDEAAATSSTPLPIGPIA